MKFDPILKLKPEVELEKGFSFFENEVQIYFENFGGKFKKVLSLLYIMEEAFLDQNEIISIREPLVLNGSFERVQKLFVHDFIYSLSDNVELLENLSSESFPVFSIKGNFSEEDIKLKFEEFSYKLMDMTHDDIDFVSFIYKYKDPEGNLLLQGKISATMNNYYVSIKGSDSDKISLIKEKYNENFEEPVEAIKDFYQNVSGIRSSYRYNIMPYSLESFLYNDKSFIWFLTSMVNEFFEEDLYRDSEDHSKKFVIGDNDFYKKSVIGSGWFILHDIINISKDFVNNIHDSGIFDLNNFGLDSREMYSYEATSFSKESKTKMILLSKIISEFT